MEFAKHFAKIRLLVLQNTTTFWYQIRITVDVSSCDSSDMNDEI